MVFAFIFLYIWDVFHYLCLKITKLSQTKMKTEKQNKMEWNKDLHSFALTVQLIRAG